jgi:hypothetical protein
LTENKDDSDGRASQAKRGNTKHAYVPGASSQKEMGNMQGTTQKKKGKENPKRIEERKTAAGKPIHTIQGSNHTHISQKEKRGKKKHTNTPIVPPAQPASNCQQQQTQWGHGIRNKTPIPNSGRGKQSKQPRVPGV